MEGTYLTTSDIVNWFDEWRLAHPSYMDTDVAAFAEALNGKIGQMDFHASNNGTAIGYADTIGEGTGVFRTVEKITEASNGQYSFINLCAENIQKQDVFKEVLRKAVGPDNFDKIMGGNWTDGNRIRTIFGDTLSIN